MAPKRAVTGVIGMLSLTVPSLALVLLGSAAGGSQTPVGEKKTGPTHRITRVTEPDAKGAVEVSVAINPTNPDHLIAASIQSFKPNPYTTNYVYVSTDGGRKWKTVPRSNPMKRQQGDDVVTFTADGLAIHGYIAFAGIRQPRPKKATSGIITNTSRDGITWAERG